MLLSSQRSCPRDVVVVLLLAASIGCSGRSGAGTPGDSKARSGRAAGLATRGPALAGTSPQWQPSGQRPNLRIPGPSLASWKPSFAEPEADLPDGDHSHVAIVTDLEVGLFPRPEARYAIGFARVGTRLPARATTTRCQGGIWYEVSGRAYLCSGQGVHIGERSFTGEVLDARARARQPRLANAVPYHYVKAVAGGPPRLSRLPTAAELAALDRGKPPAGLVNLWMKGAYLLALARKLEVGGVDIYETVAGNFVRAADLEPKPTPDLHGGRLEQGLPVALAFRDTELHCGSGTSFVRCGSVARHARFRPRETVTGERGELVLLGDKHAVPREHVRIVSSIARPRGVGADARWIHIDLSEQALTAYEGDEPVFATLVSTGRRQTATATGLYRVQRKYTTKTMRGADDDGPYVVQEVPWTMYYDGNFAIHGAYWHSRFGRTRSHGCVNVPPADARWLYYWSSPELPRGWYGMLHRRGTHIYITGETPPDQDHEEDASS